MLLNFPFFVVSPHFSLSELFGSPLVQRHVPVDVTLMQGILSLNQHHVWDPLPLFKPINQRFFFRFLVKFLTKCHSCSVSIEISEPFTSLLHFSLAVLQSIISLWKEYLEQTVTNIYGKPTDEREKRKAWKMIYLLIFWLYISFKDYRKLHRRRTQ